MTFCREFHCLPVAGGYFDQPARLMNRWQQYLVVEREAGEMRRKIEEAKSRRRGQ